MFNFHNWIIKMIKQIPQLVNVWTPCKENSCKFAHICVFHDLIKYLGKYVVQYLGKTFLTWGFHPHIQASLVKAFSVMTDLGKHTSFDDFKSSSQYYCKLQSALLDANNNQFQDCIDCIARWFTRSCCQKILNSREMEQKFFAVELRGSQGEKLRAKRGFSGFWTLSVVCSYCCSLIVRLYSHSLFFIKPLSTLQLTTYLLLCVYCAAKWPL